MAQLLFSSLFKTSRSSFEASFCPVVSKASANLSSFLRVAQLPTQLEGKASSALELWAAASTRTTASCSLAFLTPEWAQGGPGGSTTSHPGPLRPADPQSR